MPRLGMVAAGLMAASMLGGCVIVDADVRDWDDDHRGKYGYLFGAEVSARGPEVTITARSGGCTQKEHFEPVVHDRGDDRFDIGFRRRVEDNCKALVPDGRTMTWSFAELGIPRQARVSVLNPIGRH